MTIQCNEITKAYTHDIVLDHITMKITPGEHIAIVGENGCGKSTLLKVIAGIETIQEGEIIKPRQWKVAYLSQHFDEFDGSVQAYLTQSFHQVNEVQQRMQKLEEQMSSEPADIDALLSRYGKLQEQFEAIHGYEVATMIDTVAQGLSIAPLLKRSYDVLSGGEKVRVNLAHRLLQQPDVLLLDEPTNHLDLQGIRWLEQYLNGTKTKGQIVMIVTHDRAFLNHTVNKIYEIECGELICYHGNYDAYRKQKQERFAQLASDYEEQQRLIKKYQEAIRRFRQWGHEGDNEKFFKKAKMLEQRLAAIERLKAPKEVQRRMTFDIDQADQGSKQVLELVDVKKTFGSRTLLEHVSVSITRHDRIAICGNNGCGKSTLIQMILGKQDVDAGVIRSGVSVKIGYLPQMIQFADESMRLLAYARSKLHLSEEMTRRYLFQFGFDQLDAMKRLSMLSGGERTRLTLACILKDACNFIIMDEPTNHLDFSSIELIEEKCKEFSGTLLLVSHDRMLLHTLCDKVWQIENQTIHEMLLSQWEEQ